MTETLAHGYSSETGLSKLSHFFAPEVIHVATSKLNVTVCDEQMSYFLYDCFVKGARALCSLS